MKEINVLSGRILALPLGSGPDSTYCKIDAFKISEIFELISKVTVFMYGNNLPIQSNRELCK